MVTLYCEDFMYCILFKWHGIKVPLVRKIAFCCYLNNIPCSVISDKSTIRPFYQDIIWHITSFSWNSAIDGLATDSYMAVEHFLDFDEKISTCTEVFGPLLYEDCSKMRVDPIELESSDKYTICLSKLRSFSLWRSQFWIKPNHCECY